MIAEVHRTVSDERGVRAFAADDAAAPGAPRRLAQAGHVAGLRAVTECAVTGGW
jgi:hypothetical protein